MGEDELNCLKCKNTIAKISLQYEKENGIREMAIPTILHFTDGYEMSKNILQGVLLHCIHCNERIFYKKEDIKNPIFWYTFLKKQIFAVQKKFFDEIEPSKCIKDTFIDIGFTLKKTPPVSTPPVIVESNGNIYWDEQLEFGQSFIAPSSTEEAEEFLQNQ